MANETTTTTLTELIQAAITEAQFILGQGVDLSDFVLKRPLPAGKSGLLFPEWEELSALFSG